MYKKSLRVVALIIILSTLLSCTAYAEMAASKYIITYGGGCRWNGSRTVEVYFDITTIQYVDQLGVNYIYLYESTDLTSWTLVKTFSYSAYPNMMAYNDYSMGSYVSYYAAVSGRHYKATIVFLVVNGSDSETRYLYTPYI